METKTRILIVDDEPAVTKPLGALLQREGYQVAVAVNGQDGLDQVQSLHPHLVLLDIEMPFVDGREFLRRLRRAGNWTPVMMLTKVNTLSDKTGALDQGADDYITKPFSYKEVASRIGAVLRRAQGRGMPLANADVLQSGGLRLDRRSRTATLDGNRLKLSPKAFQVLEYLMLHHGEVISGERLMKELWGIRHSVGAHAVALRASELRQALLDKRATPRFIETVSSQGYRFIGEVEVGV